VPWNESAFGSLIRGDAHERPPKAGPNSAGAEAAATSATSRGPPLGFFVEVKSPDEKPGLSVDGGQYALRVRNGRLIGTAS
jgi:hypothetical protein